LCMSFKIGKFYICIVGMLIGIGLIGLLPLVAEYSRY
jgi:hypothetical protein